MQTSDGTIRGRERIEGTADRREVARVNRRREEQGN
jgi:hypothetical protein